MQISSSKSLIANLKIKKPGRFKIFYIASTGLFFLLVLTALLYQTNTKTESYKNLSADTINKNKNLQQQLNQTKQQLDELQNEDQYLRNEELQAEIDNINSTYKNAVSAYESILEIETKVDDTNELKELFAEVLTSLSDRDYKQAQEKLDDIAANISTIEQSFIQQAHETVQTPPENVAVNNSLPDGGYNRQVVTTADAGSFTVSMVAADLSSTRVVVDTASTSDCANDCPVLPLSEYVSRNGAYAGINGSYFCPSSYPSCAGKTNSFDLLVMNKDKTYLNSNNNVYSDNPAVIFGEGYIRFVSAVSQWGRDTSPNGVLSNYPLLVSNSNVVFGGDDDPKKGSKGNRSFVANKGNKVYIGVVHSATVAESARVLHALGMENGLNLDNGGSTALWSGGYKVGPGRNFPNVILFINK